MSTGSLPTAFVSYTWENDAHRDWVQLLATRLRRDGVDVMLDRWHAAPGDQLPEFMERAIRCNDFVLIVCTPRYKEKSDARLGGVGYEGDVMTGEVFTSRNQRKFIPILRKGEWANASPSWLVGRYGVDLRGEPYPEDKYQDLVTTLLGLRPTAPPIGTTIVSRESSSQPRDNLGQSIAEPVPIRITGVIVDEVTTPRNDGTPGSALYAIPFRLSRRPSAEWARLFVETWDRPPRFTTMHRPGIARVANDRVVLDGTTIQEVEQYHRETLKLVVERVNQLVHAQERALRAQREREQQTLADHSASVRDVASRISFDE